jgi:hypothetical protein
MIINLRGSNASGKTSAAREIIRRSGALPIRLKPGARPLGYAAGPPYPVTVVGSYENACGGCDTIRTVAEMLRRVERAAALGQHVLFEGILISTTFGAIGEWARGRPDVVFMFLDTPLEVCLDRLDRRRAESGRASKPLNLDNVKAKWEQNARLLNRFRAEGLRAKIAPHADPAGAIWREFGFE